jgi:hypothetical protein
MNAIQAARQAVGQSLRLPAFADPADLSPADRERLYDGLARYILEHFETFAPHEIEWAERRIDGPYYRVPLKDYSVADAVVSFSGAVADSAAKIATFQNPFINRVVIFGALGAGLYLAFKADTLRKIVKSV